MTKHSGSGGHQSPRSTIGILATILEVTFGGSSTNRYKAARIWRHRPLQTAIGPVGRYQCVLQRTVGTLLWHALLPLFVVLAADLANLAG